MLVLLKPLNCSTNHLHLKLGDLGSNVPRFTSYRVGFTATLTLSRTMSRKCQDHISSDHKLCLITTHLSRTVSFVAL